MRIGDADVDADADVDVDVEADVEAMTEMEEVLYSSTRMSTFGKEKGGLAHRPGDSVCRSAGNTFSKPH